MSERPIIFSGPMVRAILDGRKTQTRRMIKPGSVRENIASEAAEDLELKGWETFRGRDDALNAAKPAFGVGDLLWVREAIAPRYFDDGKPAYRADWTPGAAEVAKEPRWTPSIHMPRWASRITLNVTGVKVERLQDISEDDAIAEGIAPNPVQVGTWIDYPEGSSAAGWINPRGSFRSLWESIHKPGSWEANPWVAAISFERIANPTGTDR